MSKFWSKQLAALSPYIPGEQPQEQDYIKLNSNENPYPPTAAVAALLRDFDYRRLRLYPDPESHRLCAALASHHRVKASQVFPGNGSDEVLAHAFQAFFRQPKPLLFADISYSFYPVYCALYQIDFRRIPLGDEFRLDYRDYLVDNGGIVITNPNAPTGIAIGLDEIRALLEANPDSVVLIDEAYVDFGGESASSLIAEFDNLVVVQTFSKSRSLAGLRLGYALAQEPLIEALQRVKNSFNSYPIDQLSTAIALASLEDDAWFQQCRAKVMSTRERLANELNTMGFKVYPSASNFLMVSHGATPAANIYRELKLAGILVRYFNSAGIEDCLRISVGTDQQCDALLLALKEIV